MTELSVAFVETQLIPLIIHVVKDVGTNITEDSVKRSIHAYNLSKGKIEIEKCDRQEQKIFQKTKTTSSGLTLLEDTTRFYGVLVGPRISNLVTKGVITDVERVYGNYGVGWEVRGKNEIQRLKNQLESRGIHYRSLSFFQYLKEVGRVVKH